MPFDGNGVYNPLAPPNFPAVAGTVILAAQYNNQILDMATALSNCLTKDGQAKPSANINWNNKKITSLAPGVDPADAVRLDQIDPMVDANLLNGFTIGNNVAIKGTKTDASLLNLVFIGSDNNIYFGKDNVGGWWMRYVTSTNKVEFNAGVDVLVSALRVVGSISASGNITAFQP